MKLLDRLRTRAADFLAPRNDVISTSRELAEYVWRRSESDGGEIVSQETAMQFSDFYACMRVVSEDIATMPLILYRRKERGKDRVTDHWLFDLMQRPNSWQTGFEFRELQQQHLELCGNFFALKTVVRGEVTELLPIHPDRIAILQDSRSRKVTYTITWLDGTSQSVPIDSLYHVRGATVDGIRGLNPIEYHRQTIGAGIQMLKFGNRTFKNGTSAGGILEYPGQLTAVAEKNLLDSFNEKYAGIDNAGKTALLQEGAKYTTIGIKSIDAQFLESRKFVRSQICGLFRIPPHMIADLDKATFSNIEELGRVYVTYGLLPRLRRIETRANLSLIPDSLRREFFFEHLVDGLLRAKALERWQIYQIGVQTGTITRNEVREKENMNPGPAELDKHLEPQFLQGAPAPDAAKPDANPPKEDA